MSTTAVAPPELFVVMPAFNEQASVRKAVVEWFQEVENWTDHFVFLVIDDGSTDRTPEVLERLQERLGPRLEVLRHTNRGHGQSCLAGYQIALKRGAPFVFQADSDGQCDPQFFFRFWRVRERFDVLYGRRWRRDDGWQRSFASLVVRTFLLVLFRANCVDANVPYRLMRTAVLPPALARIPPTFSLANIALAVLLKKDPRRLRHGDIPIRFRERYGGEPTVRMAKFGAKAFELYTQLRSMLDAPT